ncbi:hypothetical protein FP744_10006319 [Trichoderma asperellum]
MPLKGSREEAEQKLENLRQNLQDVIKKEFRVVEHKQFILDRIETRTAGPADKDADALADTLLEKCVKEDQEQEEQEKEEQEKEAEKYEKEEEEEEEEI